MSKNYKIDEFQRASHELVQAGLFLNDRMLRPVITASIEAQRSPRSTSNPVTILEIYKLMRYALPVDAMSRGLSSNHIEAYTSSNDGYWRTEIDRIQRRVNAVNEIIKSARNGGDEAIAQAVLPELARNETYLRVLGERRDQLMNNLEPGIFKRQLIHSDHEDRTVKRSRSNT